MSVGGVGGNHFDLTTGAGPASAPAAPAAGGVPADAALAKAFGSGFSGVVAAGARGDRVVAAQYALGRLGFFHTPVDGGFGPKTADAVRAFQAAKGLAATGSVDAPTLSALDAALRAVPASTPAARAADPVAYLSGFQGFGLSRVTVGDRSKPVGWDHPEIRAAYGKFVGEYWPVLKANLVEADCKTMALFLMDQFRKKVKQDVGVQLPLPGTAQGRIPASTWTAFTADRPRGAFSRFSTLPTVRPGYEAAQAIQRLDPKQSMLYGVNLRYAGADADVVARAATTVAAWDPARDNHGDQTRPEVPLAQAQPGDIVFIDHTGDGKWDHTVNVVGVTRDAAGAVRQVKLAVGSFDDMKDADGATAPKGLDEVNDYAEEVTVDLDAAGKITSSAVTWSSEPDYVHDGRYAARTTLMELKPGGRLKLARWGGS